MGSAVLVARRWDDRLIVLTCRLRRGRSSVKPNCLKNRRLLSSKPRLGQELSKNPLAGEAVAGQFAGGAAVAAIVGGNRVDRRQRLVLARVIEQAMPGGAVAIKACAHRHDRPAGGEIADGPVAEPAAVRPDIDVLGDGELAARARDEIAVGVHPSRHRAWISEAPATRLDGLADDLVRREHRHAETGLRPMPRQVEIFEKVGVLRPEIAVALEIDVLALVFPGSDRRSARWRGGGPRRLRPKVETNG